MKHGSSPSTFVLIAPGSDQFHSKIVLWHKFTVPAHLLLGYPSVGQLACFRCEWRSAIMSHSHLQLNLVTAITALSVHYPMGEILL